LGHHRVSVVRGQTRRRWSIVAGCVALLCALPTLDSALPVSVPKESPAALRTHVLASAGKPYAGYAESNASFGLPALNGFTDLTSLLDGVTRMRVWQASPDNWRVDVLSDVGESDTYMTPRASYVWDSESELLTEVTGKNPIRLPRAADLVPPSLAVRLIKEAGKNARLVALPPRRVAGQAAAGLGVQPADRSSTVGQIDIWVLPGSWLPAEVEVFGHGAGQPSLESQFLQVTSWDPVRSVLTPQRGPGTGFTQTNATDLSGALSDLGPALLPPALAGQPRAAAPLGFGEVGVYGSGLGTFAVIEISGQTGLKLMAGARSDGGVNLKEPHGTGVVVSTSLMTVAMLHPSAALGTYVLAGFVDRQVMERAARELASQSWWIP
jgi:hypothetical protein